MFIKVLFYLLKLLFSKYAYIGFYLLVPHITWFLPKFQEKHYFKLGWNVVDFSSKNCSKFINSNHQTVFKHSQCSSRMKIQRIAHN